MKQLDEKEQKMLSKEVKRAFQRLAGKTDKKARGESTVKESQIHNGLYHV